VDASALDRARPPTARHSLDAAPDMSTRRDERRGDARCGAVRCRVACDDEWRRNGHVEGL
jgi:hypothetical protein